MLFVVRFNFSAAVLLVDFGFEQLFANVIVVSCYIEAGVRHRSYDACRRVIVDSTEHLVIWYRFARGETFFDCTFVEDHFLKLAKKHLAMLERSIAASVIVINYGPEDRKTIDKLLIWRWSNP